MPKSTDLQFSYMDKEWTSNPLYHKSFKDSGPSIIKKLLQLVTVKRCKIQPSGGEFLHNVTFSQNQVLFKVSFRKTISNCKIDHKLWVKIYIFTNLVVSLSCSTEGTINYNPQAKSGQPLILSIKFYWNTTPLICSLLSMAIFNATTVELGSCDRDLIAYLFTEKLKIFIISLFTENQTFIFIIF